MLSRRKIARRGHSFGYKPVECFKLIDSGGYKNCSYLCTDYDELDRSLRGKENVNLQISMWVDGYKDKTLFKHEVEEWTKDYPEWVFKSFINRIFPAGYRK